jgi:hypothetical protein
MTAASVPKTDRYNRQTRKDGTTSFIRKKTITEKVSSLLGRTADDSLYGDPVIIPMPRRFREAARHPMPIDFTVKVGETDELLDRAYRRLKGMNGVKLRNVVAQVVEQIIDREFATCLTFTADQCLAYLDRQLRAAGLVVQGALSWQKQYQRYSPARGSARNLGH